MRTEPQDVPFDTRSMTLERAVATVLRAGMLTSSIIIVTGVIVTLVRSNSLRSARRSITALRRGVLGPSGVSTPHSVASVVHGLVHGNGPAIVMLGLLLLILTPVMRVAVSVVTFGLQRERRFVLITLIVLIVLIGSFAVGT
ncbi:MAG: DUF1634 domain-containing protein [Acidimicrobiales bacterium]